MVMGDFYLTFNFIYMSSENISLDTEYKQLSQREQVLLRPAMWLGNMTMVEDETFVPDGLGNMVHKKVSYIPALLKVAIGEILNNSVDERQRYVEKYKTLTARQRKHFRMLDSVTVTVKRNGSIIVSDNGGIPVRKASGTNIYVANMVFGRFQSSGNYVSRTSGVVGLNGVGSKATNVFSRSFKVVTSDGEKTYSQRWSNNMSKEGRPTIKEQSEGNYTNVEYSLDLERFGMSELDDDHIKMIEKACVIAAASSNGLEIVFNHGEETTTYKYDTFRDYVLSYGFDDVYGESNDDWEYYVVPVPTVMGNTSYSVINGNECNNGTHVTYLNKLMSDAMNEHFKSKGIATSTRTIGRHYISMMNVKVADSDYTSQDKDHLTTRFQRRETIKDAVIDDNYRVIEKPVFKWFDRIVSSTVWKDICNSPIAEAIEEFANSQASKADEKALKAIQKSIKSADPRNVKKLLDCSMTSIKKRQEYCELYLIEGDSAQNSARVKRNPEYQAFYPLRGKSLQTYGKKKKDIVKNAEMQGLCVALGLDVTKPESLDTLRYNKVIIFCDADYDGIGITGLMITAFSQLCPSLLTNGQLYNCLSPVYIAKKGKSKLAFYSEEERKDFEKKNPKHGYKFRHIKGLGSLEPDDYSEILSKPRLERLIIDEDGLNQIELWMRQDSIGRSARKVELSKH